MSLYLILLLLVGIAVYWVITQILPERRRASLLRHGLAAGFLANLNERRYQQGLPELSTDERLQMVTESKAIHQVLSGRNEEGWEYPDNYQDLLGRSLLLEALFEGPLDSMNQRLLRQRDLYEEDWVSCGLGVAAGKNGDLVVALVLCRQAWETMGAEPSLGREEMAASG